MTSAAKEEAVQSICLPFLKAQPPATPLSVEAFIEEENFFNSCFKLVNRRARLCSSDVASGSDLICSLRVSAEDLRRFFVNGDQICSVVISGVFFPSYLILMTSLVLSESYAYRISDHLHVYVVSLYSLFKPICWPNCQHQPILLSYCLPLLMNGLSPRSPLSLSSESLSLIHI